MRQLPKVSEYSQSQSDSRGMVARYEYRWANGSTSVALEGQLSTPNGICNATWWESPRPDQDAPGTLSLMFVHDGRRYSRHERRVSQPTDRGLMQRAGRFVTRCLNGEVG